QIREVEDLESVQRLSRDLARATATLNPDEARYLVDTYYSLQEYRIAAASQIRALREADHPHVVLSWLYEQMQTLEDQTKRALAKWAESRTDTRWAMSITGIGPVIAAGLAAHIDIEKAPTAGHIWRFAGLDPTLRWLGREGAKQIMRSAEECDEDDAALTPEELAEYDRVVGEPTGRAELTRAQILAISRITNRRFGNLLRVARDASGRVTAESMTKALAKRPWDARLKVLCWKIGESFVKVCNTANDVYGAVYLERKALEQERNEAGAFREQAEATLAMNRIGKDTEAYKAYIQGKLPAARIHARAKRYAVKLFLSHYHHVAYETRYGQPPPRPYIFERGIGHVHFIAPPNWPLDEGAA